MILTPDQAPYYSSVPKGFYENLKYRQKVLKQCREDPVAREEYWIACKRDMLFYINVFGWTYDPRVVNHPAVPFITYDFQDEALLQIQAAIGNHDLLIEKSRDMGATWITMLPMIWRWHFYELQSFLLGSRKEEYVDKTGDPKTLFWKADFFISRLPKWLQPNFIRQYMHLINVDNDSTIDGESTNSDFGRGDRRAAILLDEFASCQNGGEITAATRDTSPCRIFNSTPKGINNEFYRLKKSSKCKVISFHWTRHPIKAAGLYYDNKGKPRSPWYDMQCDRASHPQEIAQELDIDYHGSESQFFDSRNIEELQEGTHDLPYVQGEIEYDVDTLEPKGFVEMPGGRLKVWGDVKGGRMPEGRYALGIDVAVGVAGPESSNSVISGGNRDTKKKVLEFVTHSLPPDELAVQAVVIAKWLSLEAHRDGEYIIWEANGPGRIFGNTITERLKYYNIYYRRKEEKLSKKTSDVPGWFSTKESKLGLLGDYRRALRSGDFVNPSYDALEECNQYVFMPNGSIVHSLSRTKDNAAGAGEHHGDRVIADALLNKALYQAGTKHLERVEKKKKDGPPVTSFQYRRDMYLEKRALLKRSRWSA